jgi:DNA (cytosine-5)-methyltransferase 1
VARTLTAPHGTGRGGSYRLDDQENIVAPTLQANRGKDGGGISPEETLIADTVRSHPRPGSNSNGNLAYALRKDPGGTGQGHNTNYVAQSGVRRLTPVECERLQGLPDDWTRLDAKTPDSRRYSALGDAVTANVAEWIGERLVRVSAQSAGRATQFSAGAGG